MDRVFCICHSSAISLYYTLYIHVVSHISFLRNTVLMSTCSTYYVQIYPSGFIFSLTTHIWVTWERLDKFTANFKSFVAVTRPETSKLSNFIVNLKWYRISFPYYSKSLMQQYFKITEVLRGLSTTTH